MTYTPVDATQIAQSETLPKLRAVATDPDAAPDAKKHATALLAVYAASVEYALKNGGTQESAEFSGAFDLWLYSDDSVEDLARVEAELTRERA